MLPTPETSAQGAAERQRVFFALWPDAATRQALDRLAAAAHRCCGGRRTRGDNLHLTLAFIGEVDPERCRLLRSIAATVAAPAFEFVLDRLAWWRHNRIVWAGCEPVPSALQALYENLAASLREAGFRVEERPFAAHVTLVRDARCAKALPDMAPLSWSVPEFVLVHSRLDRDGAHYDIIEGYSLRL